MNVSWWDVFKAGLTRPVVALDYDEDGCDAGEGPRQGGIGHTH